MSTMQSGIKSKGDADEDAHDKHDNRAMETVPNPPSFYENDMDKWRNKFAKHIKEREFVKKMMAKTQNINCLTKNTNIRTDNELDAQGRLSNRGKSLEPDMNNSLFQKVLKRRKSR